MAPRFRSVDPSGLLLTICGGGQNEAETAKAMELFAIYEKEGMVEFPNYMMMTKREKYDADVLAVGLKLDKLLGVKL